MNLSSMLKLFAAIGARLDEGPAQFGGFVGGQDQAAPVAPLTLEQARARAFPLTLEQAHAQDQARAQEDRAKWELKRSQEDKAFMDQVNDAMHPGHARAQQRHAELSVAGHEDSHVLAADVASLTPEQAQREIDGRLNDEAFMKLVFDDTKPGHDRAWWRFFDLHRMVPWT